ncbi:MAG TPA: hypothetical protein VH351_12895 [Bryobacteraceae bacterium]|jgi:hypothetical protein|nr:hypothetical protein [Bryobacteraceae bacterium]
MSTFDVPSLWEIFSGYVCFGLALYAGCAVIAAFWMRRHHTLVSRTTLLERLCIYGGMTLLVVLQTVQCLWEASHPGHPRSRVLRAVLPVLYLWLGNSAFRAARRDMGDDKFTMKSKIDKRAIETTTTVMKSAQTGSAA